MLHVWIGTASYKEPEWESVGKDTDHEGCKAEIEAPAPKPMSEGTPKSKTLLDSLNIHVIGDYAFVLKVKSKFTLHF